MKIIAMQDLLENFDEVLLSVERGYTLSLHDALPIDRKSVV